MASLLANSLMRGTRLAAAAAVLSQDGRLQNSSAAIMDSGCDAFKSEWTNQMTETSATIIDFTAYRMKRAAAKLSSDKVGSIAPYEAVASFYFFWCLLALIPFASLDLPRIETATFVSNP